MAPVPSSFEMRNSYLDAHSNAYKSPFTIAIRPLLILFQICLQKTNPNLRTMVSPKGDVLKSIKWNS
ncbi:hypothetical protein TNCV_2577071 [Trichonephila clavipes]|nr:hypothetical protein TNCV_2577071 [Trichonephila clavipes]